MDLQKLRAEETDPVVIIDENGLITHVNNAFETVFGWTRDEALGEPISIIIPGNLHDAHHMGFSRFLDTESPKILGKALELQAVNKKGEQFPATHYIVAEKENGKWVIAASVTPISK